MRNAKYKILKRIRYASSAKPVKRSDFYNNPKTIMQNRLIIDEMIRSNLLDVHAGTDNLHLTAEGIIALDHEEERREEIKRLSIQFWISVFLSAAALTVSIIALIMTG